MLGILRNKGTVHRAKISRLGTGLVLLVMLFAWVLPVFAEEGERVVISQPDTSQFPSISFYLEAYQQGQFMDDLAPEQIQVVEDGSARPPSDLKMIQPGIQFTIAINTSPYMGVMIGPTSIFQNIQKVLQTWAEAQPASTPNLFSLATNTSLAPSNSTDPAEWVKAVEEYNPTLAGIQPALTSLTQALDQATTPNPRPHMRRAILYITPLPTTADLKALPNLADRASQQGARMFVWLVAPPGAATPELTASLQEMTAATGGDLFVFSGTEELPKIETYLKPLQNVYQLSYLSGLNQGGAHHVTVHIRRENFDAASPEQIVTLDIQPPNPIFLAPPQQIKRTLNKAAGSNLSGLTPSQAPIQILIEFPDGHTRPLVKTRLYADGAIVAENSAPPFDRFNWPLAAYVESGRHLLKIEAVDSLGLSRASIETPVDLVVDLPSIGIFSIKIPWQRLAVGAAILSAAIAVGGVLFFVGRKRKAPQPTTAPRGKTSKRTPAKDPVTQPVPIRQEGSYRSATNLSPTWPQALVNQPAPARLVRLSESGSPLPKNAIPLNRPEVTLGSDPKQSIQVLENPSVDGLHARLYHNGDGDYRLADAGSVAGTWVNYAPVSKEGVSLEHGDLIQLGRVAFRFELSNPSRVRQPVVTPYSDEK
jgi:pSer/pThr/pTyr-binding forkhead associated (FHA) protein